MIKYSRTAQEVAKHAINYFIKNQNPLTNLKLQKILYLTWIDYYKQTGNMLFLEDFICWPYGPIVSEVYFEYSIYGGGQLDTLYKTFLTSMDIVILDKILEKYLDKTARELVDEVCKKGTPWDKIYQDGKGKNNIIPIFLIKKYTYEEELK